jgi:HK97 family phage major capsid protein
VQFDATDEPVKKAAVFLPASDEMIEDVPALQSLIDHPLQLLVRDAEERVLLQGNGGDELVGLLNRAGVIAAPAPDTTDANGIDAHGAAINFMRGESFIEPEAIVVNPADWAKLSLIRRDDPMGQAGSGGGGDAAGHRLGRRVLVRADLPTRGADAGVEQQPRRHFVKNKTAIRCESRLALVV